VSKQVADLLWEMLAKAGVKRCYGIVGDALNPTVDALRRNGAIEFVPVRHEEYGVFAAVAEAYFTGNPVTRTAMGMLVLDNVDAVLNGRPAPTLVPGRSPEIVLAH
jgi:glyoxylate carboligase